MPERKDVKEVNEVKELEEKTARSGPVRNYTDLIVYRQSYQLALRVSEMTRTFPRQEQYELGRQVRRSSRSVAANIVEGRAKRTSSAEFKRHLVIAAGEAAETKCWLDLAADERIAQETTLRATKGRIRKAGDGDPQFMEGMAEAIVRFFSFASLTSFTSFASYS
jgi:four helix bundle protein